MITVESHDGVAVFHLQHGKANALDTEFCEALVARLAEHRAGPSRAVVLTGQGRIFCAGVDLLRVLEGGRPYIERFMPALTRAFGAVAFHPKPLVAAINGHAIAGGCVIACGADHRMMASGAGRIGVPELLVGVPFPTIALELMRFVAPQALRSLLYGGDTCAPEVALQCGLVDAVVEPESLLSQAIAHARALAGLSVAPFELTKQQVLEPLARRVREEGPHVDAIVSEVWATPAVMASIRGYVERTFKPPSSIVSHKDPT